MNLIEKVDELISRHSYLEKQKSEIEDSIEKLESDKMEIEKSREIIMIVAGGIQNKIETTLSTPVNTALLSILDDPPEFVAKVVARRNTTELDFLFRENGEERPAIKQSGGGAINIAALVLRFAFWSLNPKCPVFILDEPSHFLSDKYQSKFGEMVKTFSDRLGVQVIMVTHQNPVKEFADNIIHVEKKGKISYVK